MQCENPEDKIEAISKMFYDRPTLSPNLTASEINFILAYATEMLEQNRTLKARIMELEESLHKARCVFTARVYTPRGANINHQAEANVRSWCLIHKCWADEHQIIGATHEQLKIKSG
jgi:hypothetical protein